MSSETEGIPLFGLRCRTRREVAEALHLCAGSGDPASASALRERYLAALDSAVALEEVRAAARELTGRVS